MGNEYSISETKPDHYKTGIRYRKTKPDYINIEFGIFGLGRVGFCRYST